MAQDRIENLSTILKGGNRIRLIVKGPAEKVTDRLRRIDGIREVAYEKPYHILKFPADQEPQAEVMQALMESGWTLLAMETTLRTKSSRSLLSSAGTGLSLMRLSRDHSIPGG